MRLLSRLQQAGGNARVQRLLAPRSSAARSSTESLRIQRFTTDEHREIGDLALAHAQAGFSAQALRGSPLAHTLRRGSRFRIGETVRTYGGLTADADFFAHFEDLIREQGERPGELGVAALAARNVPHFSPDSVRRWQTLHDHTVEQMLFAHTQLDYVRQYLRGIDPYLEAARTAIEADDYEGAMRFLAAYRRRYMPQRERLRNLARSAHRLAREALMRNAFADHFLADSFAAGHIVTPRAEILQEVGARLDEPVSGGRLLRGVILGSTWAELGEVRAQARSIAWHDLDNHYGVEVRNSVATWHACGDQCSSRTQASHWQATRAMVVRALAESVRHLWMAGLTGVRPRDYRSVLDLVPRPTWSGYPAWGAQEWERQLRYIRGESVRAVPGEQMTPLAVDLLPIEHCRDLGEPRCWSRFVGTRRDWIRHYSFDAWVRPWVVRIRGQAATRYAF